MSIGYYVSFYALALRSSWPNDLRLTHHASHFNELPPHDLIFFYAYPMIFLGPRPGGGNGSPCPPNSTTRYILFNVVTMIGVLLFRSQWMDKGVYV